MIVESVHTTGHPLFSKDDVRMSFGWEFRVYKQLVTLKRRNVTKKKQDKNSWHAHRLYTSLKFFRTVLKRCGYYCTGELCSLLLGGWDISNSLRSNCPYYFSIIESSPR